MIWTSPMTDTVENLILDLLEWLGTSPRPYAEVLDAWRTSCPRLPVWEEANDRCYVEGRHASGLGPFVTASEAVPSTCGRTAVKAPTKPEGCLVRSGVLGQVG
jgi:hypothetical protein